MVDIRVMTREDLCIGAGYYDERATMAREECDFQAVRFFRVRADEYRQELARRDRRWWQVWR